MIQAITSDFRPMKSLEPEMISLLASVIKSLFPVVKCSPKTKMVCNE